MTEEKKAKHWQWEKGKAPRSPGRPLGSKNKIKEDFLRDMLAAWEKDGPAIIQAALAESPVQVLRIFAGFIPKEEEHKVELSLKDVIESAERRVTELRMNVRGDDNGRTVN